MCRLKRTAHCTEQTHAGTQEITESIRPDFTTSGFRSVQTRSWVTEWPGQDWTESVLQHHIFFPFAVCLYGRTRLWHTTSDISLPVCVRQSGQSSSCCLFQDPRMNHSLSHLLTPLHLIFFCFFGHVVKASLLNCYLIAVCVCVCNLNVAICDLGEIYL